MYVYTILLDQLKILPDFSILGPISDNLCNLSGLFKHPLNSLNSSSPITLKSLYGLFQTHLQIFLNI